MGRRECVHGFLARSCETCDLETRIDELEAAIRNHRRLMTEAATLPPRQWERDTRQYDLNLWGHVGEGTDR